MIFGFLPAVITGFLLTAIPNWTDRPPIRGLELMLLTTLWLAGRLLIAMPWLTPLVSAIVDVGFLIAVAWLVWREIAVTKGWDRAPMGVLVSLLAGANILFHVLTLSGAETDRPERMALAMVMLLLTLIGGRVTPNFTEEFLAESGRAERPAPFSRYDGLSIALVVFAVVSWTVQPESIATGWMFVAAGTANLARIIHDRFCCNRGFAATTSLDAAARRPGRRARRLVGQHTVSSMPPFLAPPRACPST